MPWTVYRHPLYDVQRADGTRPEVAAVIPAILTQLVTQIGANMVQIVFVTLKQGVDYSMVWPVGFLRFGEGTLATYGPGSRRIIKFL